MVGRRGPAQAAFTNPELLELGELADADVVVDSDELARALEAHDPSARKTSPPAQRRDPADTPARRRKGRRKRIVLRFLVSPVALLGDEQGRLEAVELVRNELVADPDGGLRAQATDERETMPAGLVFRAIGYRGMPLPGVPFDERCAVIPNEAGGCSTPTARPFPASTWSAGSSAAPPA